MSHRLTVNVTGITAVQ